MNDNATAKVKEWLIEYANSFAVDKSSTRYLIKLKLDHSLRVAEDCLLIATELGWSANDINLGVVVGLLHDVGRFSQLAEFGTFHDPISVNHGERGYEVACDVDIMDVADDLERIIILESIRYHNRRDLSDTISDASLPFLHLIRDADKIDIMHIVKTTIVKKDYEHYPEILLNIDLDGPVNPDLVKEIKQTDTASYKNVLSMADMNLVRMSWIYNVKYKPALRILSDRGCLSEIISTLPDSEDIREITDKAVDYIHERLTEAAGSVS